MRHGSHKGKRKRFAAKTRTGCPNCRRRHIKCDEGRPACQKCVRSDLECEGYDSIPKPKIFQSQHELLEQNSKTHAFIVWQPGKDNVEKRSPEDAEKSLAIAKIQPIPSPKASPAIFTPQAARSINFWLSRTRSLMVRSDVGSVFWSSVVPQAAWAFQPIQDSLNATVIVHESLDRGDGEAAYRQAKLQAAMHVNKAARGLIESSPSAEEAMIMGAVLWSYGLIAGEYVESLVHLNHAARIAHDERKRRNGSQSLASFYLDTLVDSFPSALNPRMVTVLGPKLMQGHLTAMRTNAIATLRHLIMALEIYQPLLLNRGVSETGTVINVMRNIVIMAKWMLSLLLETSREDSPDSPENQEDTKAQQSPFNYILKRVQKYLLNGDEEELRRFANDLQASWGIFQIAVASNSVPILRAVLEFYKIRPLDWNLTNRYLDMPVKADDTATASPSQEPVLQSHDESLPPLFSPGEE